MFPPRKWKSSSRTGNRMCVASVQSRAQSINGWAKKRWAAAHVWVFGPKCWVRDAREEKKRRAHCRLPETLGFTLRICTFSFLFEKKKSCIHPIVYIYVCVYACARVWVYTVFLKYPSETWVLFSLWHTVVSLQLFTRRGLLRTVDTFSVLHPLHASLKSKNLTKWKLNYI